MQDLPVWLLFLVSALATYRLSLLVSKEDGPAWVFRKLRRVPKAGSSAREGLSCPWCLSIWFSAVVTGYEWWQGMVSGVVAPLWWLGVSALAIGFNQMWTRGDK